MSIFGFSPVFKTRVSSMTTPPPSPDAKPEAPTDTMADPAGASAATSGDDVIAETAIEAQLSELQAELVASNDAFLRAKAEVENIRRRADEEVSKARKFAVDSFAESMLPVADSLQAALAQPDAAADKVLEGVQATLRQLMAALERHKVVEINPPAGTKFDPHQHQAISVVPLPADSQQEANTVVAVLQKGYLIVDRVLRPALVTVAAPK
jgi:molecular chaperone GrpE